MLNLHYPEDIQVIGDGYDVMVRPYVTIEEKNVIINAMLGEQNILDRQAIMDSFLLKFCVPSENFDGMNYDLLLASGLMYKIRDILYTDISDIDRCIKRIESVEMNVSNFLDELSKATRKFAKNFASKEQVAQLLESLEKMNK